MGISRLSEFWPGWNVTDVLGEGSYGKVYKAVKNEGGFETFAAIKVISVPSSPAELKALRSEGMTESETKTYFEGIVSDFINEIKLMESLKGASNIVAVEDYKILESNDSIGWNIYIRMELLQSFDDYMMKNKLSEQDVLQIGIDLCKGLEVCSKYHIIHRDIKPANIFVSKFGDFKLGDFGIAKELEKTNSAMSSKGTYSYMAPEVAHGLRYDSTVDIYSLGIVLYTLLNNNRQPFLDPYTTQITYNDRKNAADRRLAGEPLPKPCNASAELSDIILSACSYSAARRFKSPTAFKNALIAYKNGDKPASSPNVPLQKKPDVSWVPPATPPKPETPPVTPKKEERLAELMPEKKRSSVGKNIAIIFALILVIGFLVACFTVFMPALLDKQQEESQKESELESQLADITEPEKQINLDITETTQDVTELVAGGVYTVDPYVNVYADSGECWLFVEIYSNEIFEYYIEYDICSHWEPLPGYDKVYYMKVDDSTEDQSFGVFVDDCIAVPSDLNQDEMDELKLMRLGYEAFALHTSMEADAVDAWEYILSSDEY